MEKLTRAVLKNLNAYEEKEVKNAIRIIYEQVLDIYVAGSYPNGRYGDTLMCSIHNSFTDGHNCVGCNLESQSKLLLRFLAGFRRFTDIQAVSVQFHTLLYLLSERYNRYVELMGIPAEHSAKHFGIFKQILHWANFLKHPKGFVLVHHPRYWIDGLDDVLGRQPYQPAILIDDKFVGKYYASAENKNELNSILAKHEDVTVLFPNPVNFIKRIVAAQQQFVHYIQENQTFRELLNDKASIIKEFTMSEEIGL